MNTTSERPKKTVQFLGKGHTVGWVPDEVLLPGIERWGLNSLVYSRFSGNFDDWDRWFDLHPTEHIIKTRPETYEWYKRQTKPIYRLEVDPEIPASVAYPKEVLEQFRTTRYADSLDLLFALALHEGYERIELCWFPQGDRPEHRRGVPTACYWIGRCEQAGVEVVIHGASRLQPPEKIYGFQIVYGMIDP